MIEAEFEGWNELNELLQNLVNKFVKPPGLSQALQKGASVIADQTKKNIWALFDTKGDFPNGVIVVGVNQYRADVRVDRIYAAVQEFGGTFNVTEKQRAFFWAKFMETEDGMWKALALSEQYTIPARPYLRPAYEDKHDAAIAEVGREIVRILLEGVRAH